MWHRCGSSPNMHHTHQAQGSMSDDKKATTAVASSVVNEPPSGLAEVMVASILTPGVGPKLFLITNLR